MAVLGILVCSSALSMVHAFEIVPDPPLRVVDDDFRWERHTGLMNRSAVYTWSTFSLYERAVAFTDDGSIWWMERDRVNVTDGDKRVQVPAAPQHYLLDVEVNGDWTWYAYEASSALEIAAWNGTTWSNYSTPGRAARFTAAPNGSLGVLYDDGSNRGVLRWSHGDGNLSPIEYFTAGQNPTVWDVMYEANGTLYACMSKDSSIVLTAFNGSDWVEESFEGSYCSLAPGPMLAYASRGGITEEFFVIETFSNGSWSNETIMLDTNWNIDHLRIFVRSSDEHLFVTEESGSRSMATMRWRESGTWLEESWILGGTQVEAEVASDGEWRGTFAVRDANPQTRIFRTFTFDAGALDSAASYNVTNVTNVTNDYYNVTNTTEVHYDVTNFSGGYYNVTNVTEQNITQVQVYNITNVTEVYDNSTNVTEVHEHYNVTNVTHEWYNVTNATVTNGSSDVGSGDDDSDGGFLPGFGLTAALGALLCALAARGSRRSRSLRGRPSGSLRAAGRPPASPSPDCAPTSTGRSP